MIKRFEIVLLKEADEFLEQVDEKAYRKITGNFVKATYIIDPTLFKKLQNEIWEFRTIHLRRHYRFLAFWDQRNQLTKVVVTHGLIKKSDKLPAQEIEKALNSKYQYLNQTS